MNCKYLFVLIAMLFLTACEYEEMTIPERPEDKFVGVWTWHHSLYYPTWQQINVIEAALTGHSQQIEFKDDDQFVFRVDGRDSLSGQFNIISIPPRNGLLNPVRIKLTTAEFYTYLRFDLQADTLILDFLETDSVKQIFYRN